MTRLDPQALVHHLGRLGRAAGFLCDSREDAEDLVQETLVQVLARPRGLRRDEEWPYLLRALHNTHVSARRAAARHPRTAATLDQLQIRDQRADACAEAALRSHELFGAIAQLPEDFREALLAVDVAGLSYREAAAALGTRERTIATRLHRGRERVERLLATASGPMPPRRDESGRVTQSSPP